MVMVLARWSVGAGFEHDDNLDLINGHSVICIEIGS